MTVRKDILLSDNGNFATANGDFTTGLSDEQHVAAMLGMNKGELKEHPTLGVGLNNYINDDTSLMQLRFAIRENMKVDGYSLKNMSINQAGKLLIDYE